MRIYLSFDTLSRTTWLKEPPRTMILLEPASELENIGFLKFNAKLTLLSGLPMEGPIHPGSVREVVAVSEIATKKLLHKHTQSTVLLSTSLSVPWNSTMSMSKTRTIYVYSGVPQAPSSSDMKPSVTRSLLSCPCLVCRIA